MAKKPQAKVMEFQWEGTDRSGKKVSGEQEGPNIAFVRAVLRRQGVTPKKIRRKAKPLFELEKRIKGKDLAIASRQIATMVGAGIPLAQSLGAISKNKEHPKLARLFTEVRQEVESGTNMSNAIARHPKYFDRLFVSLVRVGEHSGTLDLMLDKISTYMEKIEIIKGKIKSAMFYPIMVIFVAIVIIAIMLLFVIPAFEELFLSSGTQLPSLTRMVVELSHWFREWWWVAFLGCLAFGIFVGFTYKRSPKFQYTVDRIKLRIPVLGEVLRKGVIARVTRTLAIMFGAGVPLVDSLSSVAEAGSNRVYQNALLEVRDDVSAGRPLERSMAKTNLFPSLVLQMVATGEESGQLEEMLDKSADFYEREVDEAVAAISSLIEPFLIIFIGAIVGVIVVAMYLPIFKLASVF